MKKLSILFPGLILMTMSLIASPSDSSNLFTASLYPVSPDSVNGILDAEFDVTVHVEDVSSLFGASFELHFDKTYLTVAWERTESFLGDDVIFISQHDDVNGTVGIGVTKKAGENAANGSGDLATIRFKFIKSVVRDTALSFALSAVSANDSLGNPIGLVTNPDSTITLYPYALSVSETSWTAPAEGGVTSPITVSNSRSNEGIEYSIAEEAEWLSISPVSGSTSGTFGITAGANRTGSARTAVVAITATSPSGAAGSPRTVTVTQESTAPALSVGDTVWAAPARGGVSPEILVANSGSAVTISYAVSEDADWLSVSPDGGATPGAFGITVEANHTWNVRKDTVFVTAVSPSGVFNSRQNVIIAQQPLPIPILRPVCSDSVQGTTGAAFDVTVEISDAIDLFGIGFQLNFDRIYLNVLSSAAGSFFGDDALFLSNIDNANGKVSIGLTENSGRSGVDGTGDLATIRFKVIRDALQDTTVNFTFSSLNANDSTMTPSVLHADSGATRLKALHVGVDNGGSSKPTAFHLYQNSPNPFNPTTTIHYSIPKSGDVTLEVFDGLGRLIATLFKGHREAGEFQTVFDSKRFSSGAYYCRLGADGSVMTRKMMLVR